MILHHAVCLHDPLIEACAQECGGVLLRSGIQGRSRRDADHARRRLVPELQDIQEQSAAVAVRAQGLAIYLPPTYERNLL